MWPKRITDIWKSKENPWSWKKTRVCHESQEKKGVKETEGGPMGETLLKVQRR